MSNNNHEELKAVLREDQLDNVDADILSVLTGDYDDESAPEEIETVMDAEEDEDLLDEIPDETETLVRDIADECQGEDEDGLPKSAAVFYLEQINPYLETRRVLLQEATVAPTLSINTRDIYIEFCYDFKSQSSGDLRKMWQAVERYGELANDTSKDTVELPHLTFLAVPIAAYGTYYMSAESPISWSLQSAKPGGDACQIKLLFEAENIGFYESDDLDMDDVAAEVIREVENDIKYQEAALEMELRKQEEEAKKDELSKKSRRYF